MRRALLALSVVFAAACSSSTPAAPSSTILPVQDLSTPAALNLATSIGTGQNGGKATLTAKVQDGRGMAIANVLVTFSTDAGTIAPATAATAADGTASAQLVASSNANVTVTVGTLSRKSLIAMQPYVAGPGRGYSVVLIAGTTSTTAGNGINLSAIATPQNGAPEPASYSWDCNGDGTPDIVTTTGSALCRYFTVGSFVAKVTATGGEASGFATTSVSVTATPLPSYGVSVGASPSSVTLGGSSTLTATVTAQNGAPAPTSYAWDCGNGTTVTTASATQSCTYASVATFSPKVTVTGGSVTGTGGTTVTVPALIPVVTLTCTPVAGKLVNCAAAATLAGVSVASGSIIVGSWDFGDGGTGTTSGVANNLASNTYTAVNTYTIRALNVSVPGETSAGSGTASVTVLP